MSLIFQWYMFPLLWQETHCVFLLVILLILPYMERSVIIWCIHTFAHGLRLFMSSFWTFYKFIWVRTQCYSFEMAMEELMFNFKDFSYLKKALYTFTGLTWCRFRRRRALLPASPEVNCPWRVVTLKIALSLFRRNPHATLRTHLYTVKCCGIRSLTQTQQ